MSLRPILIHEFLDSRLDNILGDPGTLRSSSPPPAILRANGCTVGRGVWFAYDLEKQRQNVIAIEIDCRVHLPGAGDGLVLPLVELPGAFEVALRFNDPVIVETVDGRQFTRTRLRVRFGAREVVANNVLFPFDAPLRLGVRWLTSGQLWLIVDGQPARYEPSIAPNARLTLSAIAIGTSSLQTDRQTRFFMSYLSVRILQDDDSARQVLAELPSLGSGDPEHLRCARLVRVYQRDIVSELRKFMRKFVVSTTASWQKTNQSQSPDFKDAATIAHIEAMSALTAFMEVLRKGDNAGVAEYFAHVEVLLGQLSDELPDAFRELVDNVERIPRPPQRCIDLAERLLAGDRDTARLLRRTNEGTLEIARRLAGRA